MERGTGLGSFVAATAGNSFPTVGQTSQDVGRSAGSGQCHNSLNRPCPWGQASALSIIPGWTRAREEESAEVQRMLKEGVIETASSERASPVDLVPKPDGTLRFCVDYRKLNAVTTRETYPLPRMDEFIEFL
jgi:hypothetical protein